MPSKKYFVTFFCLQFSIQKIFFMLSKNILSYFFFYNFRFKKMPFILHKLYFFRDAHIHADFDTFQNPPGIDHPKIKMLIFMQIVFLFFKLWFLQIFFLSEFSTIIDFKKNLLDYILKTFFQICFFTIFNLKKSQHFMICNKYAEQRASEAPVAQRLFDTNSIRKNNKLYYRSNGPA